MTDDAFYAPNRKGPAPATPRSWYILLSSTNYTTYVGYLWGLAGDVPLLKRP